MGTVDKFWTFFSAHAIRPHYSSFFFVKPPSSLLEQIQLAGTVRDTTIVRRLLPTMTMVDHGYGCNDGCNYGL